MRIVIHCNAPGILGETIEILPSPGEPVRVRHNRPNHKKGHKYKGKNIRPRVHRHNK